MDADDLPGLLAAAVRRAARPLVLVLDYLHEVSSPAVHAGLVRLIERPLPMLSLLVTTRREPPWPLARLRLAGLLAEVRANDLAFSTGEAAVLFRQLHVDLTETQVERLVKRTEGWPAGLRLVAMHLQGRADVERCPQLTAWACPDGRESPRRPGWGRVEARRVLRAVQGPSEVAMPSGTNQAAGSRRNPDKERASSAGQPGTRTSIR